MATYTSHYNLTKPEGTERVNIAIINQNMDAIDTQMYKNAQSIIANHGGMAIPSNNNTHAAVSSGQYVYVYNHSSLAEGMYVAKSAISTNGALSLSNLTAVSGGGLNHVYSTLNSNLGKMIIPWTFGGGETKQFNVTFPCVVCIGRKTSSETPQIVYVDNWGGIMKVTNGDVATITVDSTNHTVDVQSKLGAYSSMLIICANA